MPDIPADEVLTVHIRDGQYNIRTAPGQDDFWPDSVDGVFVGEDNWAAVLCGTSWGVVELVIRPELSEPAIEDGWDMTAERSMEGADGTMNVKDLYSDREPVIVEAPTGWMRVRLSVRGREAAANAPEFASEAVEHHLLQYWPADCWSEPATVQGPDSFARRYLD